MTSTQDAYTTLVDAGTLARHLDDPLWIVVDARFDLADPGLGDRQYRESHVRGAIRLDLDRDLSAKPPHAINGGRHPLPSRDEAARRFAAHGIGDGMQVAVVDAAGGMFAARVWWMLRWVGHARVAVLDGGMPHWTALGLPTESGDRKRAPAVLALRAPLARLATADEVLANVASRERALIDARAPDRYDGSNETIDAVGGHIPGAVNAFFKRNLGDDGRFLPRDALRARFEAATGGREAVHQCGSGVTACHNVLAMAHAGLPEGALYAGSWSEWIEDPRRPVATGA